MEVAVCQDYLPVLYYVLWLPRFGFRPSDPPVDAVHMIFAVLSTLL